MVRGTSNGCQARPASWAAFVLAVGGVCAAATSGAVPPPPPYPETRIELPPDGGERIFANEVLAYRQVPLALHARAGDELLLSLTDSGNLLVLDVEAPSGLRWIQGAKPGADGLRLSLQETGTYRLHVVMSSDAARNGKKATFELRLRLRRMAPTLGP